MPNNRDYVDEKVGVFLHPKPKDVSELSSGEIGFITTGIKIAIRDKGRMTQSAMLQNQSVQERVPDRI